MHAASFFWHDYETFGTDPCRDRPAQFAGWRTTLDLEPIGDPVSFYCKPAPDVLPQPVSCLITGISPQRADRDGVIEAEFAARVYEELSAPGTCGAGFNSIRFDDEFTRNLLYRNFYDPYEREWKNDNSRWDIIDLARMCYALRPDGIEWPHRDDGNPSFRLEDLTKANDLTHAQAHDALSDVQGTIALARLLRKQQPRLWDFYLGLRDKNKARNLLDFVQRQPLLHVSSRYPSERACLAVVIPLAQHPAQPNKVIVYDLDTDPTPLIELDAGDIADRVFTPRSALPEGIERIPLKAVSVNRSPALAPLSVLKNTDLKRIRLDMERIAHHAKMLHSAADVAEKARRVFAQSQDSGELVDAELAIYRGFASDADRNLCAQVRRTPTADLATRAFAFQDTRFGDLLFRYRARNFPATLSTEERQRWEEFRNARLTQSTPLTTLTLDQYLAEIGAIRADPATAQNAHPMLDQLEDWGREIATQLNVNA